MTLVAFDFDGTLSESEMTVLLGEERGVADEVEAITERAMNDEIDYADSLRKRCTLYDGLPLDDADTALSQVRLRPGAAEVIEDLNEEGISTAILTGGFERGVELALGIKGVTVDTVVSNRLPAEDGELTGAVEGPLIEGTKDDALADLAETVGASETVAVGDGANDLPMLKTADLAIGFDPKPAVLPACDLIVGTMEELRDALRAHGVL